MLTFLEFLKQRQLFANQFFAHPTATRTVMVSSHIWWSDHVAYGAYAAGYNVLLYMPLYLLYIDPAAAARFDAYWSETLTAIKEHKVELILAGNSTAMVPHARTGELLHRAAGVPVVHYWWDEIRSKPPFAGDRFSPNDYLAFLRDDRTLNAVWDIDVLEELAAFHGITNTFHLPLATTPEFWPQACVPMVQRPLAANFLGNCHFTAEWIETDADPLSVWARRVIDDKQRDLRRSMAACIRENGALPGFPSRHLTGDAWTDFGRPFEFINACYMHRTRNTMLQAAAEHLTGKLALVGKGWDKLGLRANADHAGENTGPIYAQSKASLNLFGGCVHGGMPLRPFDIAAAHGLILSHMNRELPELFEPGKECLAFSTPDELCAALDRILAAPQQFDAIVQAGHTRVLAQHTWRHRMAKLLAHAFEYFGK